MNQKVSRGSAQIGGKAIILLVLSFAIILSIIGFVVIDNMKANESTEGEATEETSVVETEPEDESNSEAEPVSEEDAPAPEPVLPPVDEVRILTVSDYSNMPAFNAAAEMQLFAPAMLQVFTDLEGKRIEPDSQHYVVSTIPEAGASIKSNEQIVFIVTK